MKGIVYSSQAEVAFDGALLKELESHAARRNAELGVTGYLYFEEGRFFQYIEGRDQVVTEMMSRIQADYRHTVRQVIHDDHLLDRRFPSWSMKVLESRQFIGLESLLQSHLEFMRQLNRGDDASQSAIVWRMIQRISDVRAQLMCG